MASVVHANWLCRSVADQPHILPSDAPFPVSYVWYVIDISLRPADMGVGVWSVVKEVNPTANDWQIARMVQDMILRNGIQYNYCTHDGDRLIVPVLVHG